MAGYFEFTTGQVLTAAQVNDFLMEQAVMTFADAAARTTALAAVLREGLLTYNLDTNALERYDGTAWVPAAPETPGIGSNVVQTLKTDTFTTTSTSLVDVSGLSVTITPSTDTSKILVVYSLIVGQSDASNGAFTVAITDGSDNAIFQSDASGSQNRGIFGMRRAENASGQFNVAGAFVWSPNVATPVTAKMRISRTPSGAGTVTVNRSGSESNDNGHTRAVSSLVVIEVAA